jgi:hypothetical protein
MPWRLIGLWDVEAPTFSWQSVHRWRWGCQPYAPGALHPQEDSWYSFLLEADLTQGHSAAGRIKSSERLNDLIRNWTRELPTCSIVPQPITLVIVLICGFSCTHELPSRHRALDPLQKHWCNWFLAKLFSYTDWTIDGLWSTISVPWIVLLLGLEETGKEKRNS